jgi:hypothetical protein
MGSTAAGAHVLTAVARDPAGNTSTSVAVPVTVAAVGTQTGAINVVVATTGAGADRDGYTVGVGNSEAGSVAMNGALLVPDVAVGTPLVQLEVWRSSARRISPRGP